MQSFKPSEAVGAGDPVPPLIAAIDRAVAEFVLDGEATAIAVSLWVTLHGLVPLELAGALDASGAAFRSTILSVTPAPRCQEPTRTLPARSAGDCSPTIYHCPCRTPE
ncbi:TetR-like C-terminal domain-containing protein [Streptomyces mirabilis]|uniref:TetR-like C-terminal domain-containing protein n=1 Tax=Streptomyces mirabilis TaxID=68239 RepID=UPI0033218941